MSIISKLKGAKKAADEHKAKAAVTETEKPAPAPYRHVPTHAATDALTGAPSGYRTEDREQIKLVNQQRLSRIGSDYSARSSTTVSVATRPATSHTTSTRPARPGYNRSVSDSSLDFTPGSPVHFVPVGLKSSSSSLKSSHSRNASFQGLEKVLEDANVDSEPVFAAALLANRTKAPRAHRGSHRSSLGKSPLSSVESSVESSPVSSEASSDASGSSIGAMELRPRIATYPPVIDIHPGEKVGDMFSQPERTYFSHRAPVIAAAVPREEPAEPVVKKERLSFIKRLSNSNVIAAH